MNTRYHPLYSILATLLLLSLFGCQEQVFDKHSELYCQASKEEVELSFEFILPYSSPQSMRANPNEQPVDPGDYADSGLAYGFEKEGLIRQLSFYVFKYDSNTNSYPYYAYKDAPWVEVYDLSSSKYETRRARARIKLENKSGKYKMLVIANYYKDDGNTSDNAWLATKPRTFEKAKRQSSFNGYYHSWYHFLLNGIQKMQPGKVFLTMTGETQEIDLTDDTKYNTDGTTGKRYYPVSTQDQPIELERPLTRIDVDYSNSDGSGQLLDPRNQELRLSFMALYGIRAGSDFFREAYSGEEHGMYGGHLVEYDSNNPYATTRSYVLFDELKSDPSRHQVHPYASLSPETAKPESYGAPFSLKASAYSGSYVKAGVITYPYYEVDGDNLWPKETMEATVLEIRLVDKSNQLYTYQIPIGELYRENTTPGNETKVSHTGLKRNTNYQLTVKQKGKDLQVLLSKFRVAKEKEVVLDPIEISPYQESAVTP